MFIKFVESEGININRGLNLLQKPTSGAHVLNNKMAEREDDFAVVWGEDVVYRRITKRNRNEVEGHGFKKD